MPGAQLIAHEAAVRPHAARTEWVAQDVPPLGEMASPGGGQGGTQKLSEHCDEEQHGPCSSIDAGSRDAGPRQSDWSLDGSEGPETLSITRGSADGKWRPPPPPPSPPPQSTTAPTLSSSTGSVMSIGQLCHAEDVEVAPVAARISSVLLGGSRRGASSDSKRRLIAPQSTNGSPAAPSEGERRCTHCGTQETPSWRRNSHGRLLCNACGLYERIHREPRRFVVQDGVLRAKRRSSAEAGSRSCANCGTDQTPMWRKIINIYYCNACAIFFRANGFHRPRAAVSK